MRPSLVYGAAFALTAVALSGAATAAAQSDSDKQTIQKAKAIYYMGPAPASIGCDVSIDWDKFVKALNMPMDDKQKAQMDQMKSMKLSFVSTGETQTDVTVDLPPGAPPNLTGGLKQQVQGLMQIFWSAGFGDFFPKDGESYELAAQADGYSLNETKSGTKAVLNMDKQYLITGMKVESTPVAMEMKTTFSKEEDNLLHIRQIDESVNMGDSTMVVKIGLDYQKLSGFYVPQHASMSVGPLDFDYTLSGCTVKPKDAAPAVAPASSPSPASTR